MGDAKPCGDMQSVERLEAGVWLGIGAPKILSDKRKINRPGLF